MFRIQNILLVLVLIGACTQLAVAQGTIPNRLIWEVNKVDLGAVLQEQGPQIAEFKFTHTQDSLYFIENVWTDCGCTTVDYTRDTLEVGESGILRVSYDPSTGAGYFSRRILVHGNLAGTQDTLYVEGTAIPLSSTPETTYKVLHGNLGFRLDKINMGQVFDNVPKIKHVEVFNFGETPILKDSMSYAGPSYINVNQVSDAIYPNERGILEFSYDGQMKGDLGFFEDEIQLYWRDSTLIRLPVLAEIFEYFAPFPKDDLDNLPQLVLGESEIDLKKISASTIQVKQISLTNKGNKDLEIRKVQGNCECLVLEIPKTTIHPGETVTLTITFDPKGRQGIDQRNIYIFSNDPVNPVQLLLIKSRVE